MKIRIRSKTRTLILLSLLGFTYWTFYPSTSTSSKATKQYSRYLGPVCSGPGIPGAKTEPAFDLLSFTQPPYLDNYRNPCWHGDTVHNRNLLCVPLFYIIGQPKCGTSDLFYKLTSHPQIADRQYYSAMHWLARGRFKEHIRDTPPEYLSRETFYSFSKLFINNTKDISSALDVSSSNSGYHQMIIGDASPSTFSDNPHWEEYVGNENCQEPRIINSIYLRHIVPQAKVILTLRDPVSRLYSSYFYFLRKGSPEDFHERAVREVTLYTDCFKRHSVRQCAYNNTLSKLSKLCVAKGLYSIYLEDWFKTFPREQIFISFLEDYAKNPENTLTRIFKFLEVSPLSTEELTGIASSGTRNIGNLRQKSANMLYKTRKLLNDFYEPYNTKLFLLLSDPNPT